MSVYPIGIVGESFNNSDGGSRQAEIKRCANGEPVALEREPDNPYDSQCVKVISARGVQIGNIGRGDYWIAERIDAGRYVDAAIDEINDGDAGKFGVVLRLRTSPDDPPWQAHATGKGCAGSIAVIGLAGLLAIGLAGVSPVEARLTPVGKAINIFCRDEPKCIATQREALRYYLNLSVVYQAPEPVMEQCMRAGKIGKTVDWVKSERCMRAWSRGRPSILPGTPGYRPPR